MSEGGAAPASGPASGPAHRSADPADTALPPEPGRPPAWIRYHGWVSWRIGALAWENLTLGLPRQGGLVRALMELEATAEWKSTAARRRASAYGGLYYLLGLPAAVLAAIAGATALASTAGRVAAGVIALTSAALSAAVTFLDAAGQRTKAETDRARWDDLYNDLHVARLTEWTGYTTVSGPRALYGFYNRAAAIRAGRDPGEVGAPPASASPSSDAPQPLFGG